MAEGQKIIEDRYLGDGVYASYDGYHVWLDLRDQKLPGKELVRIALDDKAFSALLTFVADLSERLADAAVKRIEQAKRIAKSKEPSHDD